MSRKLCDVIEKKLNELRERIKTLYNYGIIGDKNGMKFTYTFAQLCLADIYITIDMYKKYGEEYLKRLESDGDGNEEENKDN